MSHDIAGSLFMLPPPFNMIVLIVLIASVAGVITTVAKQVRRYLTHREELDLKRDMLERGMSAQEIEQVMRAGITDSVRRVP